MNTPHPRNNTPHLMNPPDDTPRSLAVEAVLPHPPAQAASRAPSRREAEELDAADPLGSLRALFRISDPDTIYLDGNSLGRLPAATPGFLADLVDDGWGKGLVRSWGHWIDWAGRIGDRLAAQVLGARPGEVALSDSTSVNLYKLAAAALDARPGRGAVVFDAQDFPTDRYILQGLAEQRGLTARQVSSPMDTALGLDQLGAALDDDVALVVLSLVHYRSGALLDMASVNELARAHGALVLWDLSHAVGSVPIDLSGTGSDLAVGCTYKYLNGGPGAPAFLYVRRELQSALRQPVWGWYGQRDQFHFGDTYEPVDGVERFLAGTPPVLSMAAVEPALDVIEQAGVRRVRAKALALGDFAVRLADAWLTEHGVRLASPRGPEQRGSHLSLTHPEAWRVCRALAAEAAVVCDYRVPDRLRIGMPPLYTRFTEVWDAMDRLRDVLANRRYESYPRTPARVT
ncbi:kynureninase [Streptomyces tauricus]|uniref:kynureninase n=1 Tax=Streptomyces tauricus TaxID=68274 RepID=UPI0033AA055D